MKKVGSYKMVGKLGEGQFGTVYKAVRDKTNEEFALKTISKRKVVTNRKMKSLFDTEVAVMKKIRHPNIIHLHDFMETNNNYYLVLDYCNGGDLETHLRKNRSLGEQESIYFLMQISNGFKELHRYKIMHRDFKLANLFLNDDKIVIGDFGFAKSGAEMAETKLGSPITMAPELLNARGRVRYTNKADLWSVGVCFYHMIFGTPPFTSRAMPELQRQVMTRSGRNLQFPRHKSISSECKDLLRRMLEPNPKARISWHKFFNHPLFEKYNKGKMNCPDMRQSVMFKNNEDRVKNLWQINKKMPEKEVDLIEDPRKLKLNPPVPKKPSAAQPASKPKARSSTAVANYVHHKKIIVFMMQVCRKLRNLSKQKEKLSQEIRMSMMKSALVLLKKGIIYNNIAIETIKKKKNSLRVADFPNFLKSTSCGKIYKELMRDTGVYKTLLSHLQTKLVAEIGLESSSVKIAYELTQKEETTLKDIEGILVQEIQWIASFFKQAKSEMEGTFYSEFVQVLSDLYMTTNLKQYFPFMVNGLKFDWRQFEAGLNTKFYEEVIEKQVN